MKRTFLILSLCVAGIYTASAQQQPKFNKELKLNLPFIVSADGWHTGAPAPVFTLETRKKNRHDFELGNFRFGRQQEPENSRSGEQYFSRRSDAAVQLRYQYTYSFLSDARLSPNLGASLQSALFRYAFSQPGLRTFQYGNLANHNILALVPGLRWQMNARVGIDYAIAVPLLQHSFYYSALSSRISGNRRYGAYEVTSEPFREFQSRIGVFIKLFPAPGT